MEKTISYLHDNDPIILIGFCGPIYPQIRTVTPSNRTPIRDYINTYTDQHGFKDYDRRHVFMGISDFSYMGFQMNEEEIDVIKGNMPGIGIYYDVPLEQMKSFNLELINIGPWGKDLHMITERVYKADFHYNTPNIMLHVLKNLLIL